MKRALVLLLLFALATVLGACEGAEETPTTGLPTTTTTTTAASTTTSVAQTTTTLSPQEPIVLKYATTFRQTDAGGKIVQRFCDYIEDATAGAVMFNVYFDGILGSRGEELGLVGLGSVDMISLDQATYAGQMPLLNFPVWARSDPQTAVDYFNHLVFENADTASLIQAEATANNIKYLGFTSGGGNVFLSKTPFSLLSDLVGKEFGAAGPIPAFTALGYALVETPPSDVYQALSEGVIDATWMSFGQTVDLRWYEIAKFYMWDGAYTVGNALSVNLDTWNNKLTPETQQIFKDAAKDAEAFSLKLDAADTAANLQVMADAGVTVGSLTSEDQAAWYQLLFDASAADCMARAQRLGLTGDMIKVLARAAEFTGVTWAPPTQ